MAYVLYAIATVYTIGFLLAVVAAIKAKYGFFLTLYSGLIWPQSMTTNLYRTWRDAKSLFNIQNDPEAPKHLATLKEDYPDIDEFIAALSGTDAKVFPHLHSVAWLLRHTTHERCIRVLWAILEGE